VEENELDAENSFKHSAVSILFSVEEYTEGVDKKLFEKLFASLMAVGPSLETSEVLLEEAFAKVDWT